MELDDKQDILKIGEMSVAKSAYAVHAFTDPVESLDHFRGNQRGYWKMFADVKMPGMSGPELASRVKMIKPDVAVVIMTSFEVDKDMVEVLRLIEWSDLLQDPFNTTDVYVAVNRHLTGVSC